MAGDIVPPCWVTGNAVVVFDYLPVGESCPRGAQGLTEDAGVRYILAFMGDLVNVSLKPAAVCTDDLTAASLLI